jgi:hypothetical protein
MINSRELKLKHVQRKGLGINIYSSLEREKEKEHETVQAYVRSEVFTAVTMKIGFF